LTSIPGTRKVIAVVLEVDIMDANLEVQAVLNLINCFLGGDVSE
jgi:hypothetical protein